MQNDWTSSQPGGGPATPAAGQSAPPRMPQVQPQSPGYGYPPRRRSKLRWLLYSFLGFVFVSSIVMNLYLLLLVAAYAGDGFEVVVMKSGAKDQVVAIYDLSGMIDGEAAGRFEAFVDEVARSKNVRAVVLRVNSPGGAVSAADQIHQSVQALRDRGKKVVVSMGGVAASGGYYVSAAANEILAEPTTITGSIGVIATWPVIRKTLDKIGVEMVVMKSTHARGWKDEGGFLDKPDPRQEAHLQAVLDTFQARFEAVVRSGRGELLKAKPNTYTLRVGEGEAAHDVEVTETEPFNGKIYLAEEAKQLGLIDAIGYQDEAIERAGALAGLGKPRVVLYRMRRGLLRQMLESRKTSLLSLDAEAIDDLQTPRIQMLWKAQ